MDLMHFYLCKTINLELNFRYYFIIKFTQEMETFLQKLKYLEKYDQVLCIQNVQTKMTVFCFVAAITYDLM